MTPIQRSQYSHVPPSKGSHNRFNLHPFLPVYETSSLPCAIFRNICQGEPHESDHPHGYHSQQGGDEHFPSCGSPGCSGRPTSPPSAIDEESRKKDNTTREHCPSKRCSANWVSSKMKLVSKMMNPDRITSSKPREKALQAQDPPQRKSIRDNNSSNRNNQSPPGGIIRVCSDCNTTKTPLWRSGPRGPKSLCNACGIRQRKARRAMAAASGLIPAAGPEKVRKEKITDGDRTVPFKKRCKFISPQTPKKLHFDDFATNLIKNAAFQRVFPQDEKEAAILLMAFSCGLIRG